MSTKTKETHIDRLKRIARPATPGDVVADLIESLEMTQGQLASRLGVGRQTINHLLNGKRAVTLDMAHRLGRFFGNGAALWLDMQRSVELWDALHMDEAPYQHIEPLCAAA